MGGIVSHFVKFCPLTKVHLTAVAAFFVTKISAWHENEIMANGGKKGARVTECSLGH